MKVVELMKTGVKSIPHDAVLADAIAMMLDAEISALPVLDQEERPIGVVTHQDVLAACLHSAGNDGLRGPDRIGVTEAMSPWPPWVDPETSVSDAAKMMSYLDLKRVFVVDQSAVVGVFSQTDVVDALSTTTYARRA
ncbi:MAG TPA: CBS domain-containing protein [Gemmatimonadales bacterium]|jgi:CBS domain-containing protein|nr:CBS domain-containing protein [Gemmatimonadales bacterium]